MAGQRSSSKRSHSYSETSDNGGGGGGKRRNHGGDGEREQFVIDADDTVYRYLCPVSKAGSLIGRGGEVVKRLRADTNSKIQIGDTLRFSDERVVTIYSPNDATNAVDDSGELVSAAQDALFRVHDIIIADVTPPADDNEEEEKMDDGDVTRQVTARLLVPSDQIGCVIGKGGEVVKSIRSETGAQIRIMKDDHLPACALSSDELVLVSGEAPLVKKALFRIASRLHDNPSRSQHLLTSSTVPMYASSMMGPYEGDARELLRSSGNRDEGFSREFSIRMICATVNIGSVIGKGGAIINQIREESGAAIKVDSSQSEEDDTLITVTAKEFLEDRYSSVVEAAVRLQPRCSDRVERDSGILSFTTRILVPASRIGCLIGKGGAVVNEMRRITKANIRILSKEDLPKIAAEDDQMVQISGDLDIAKEALIHVVTRLRGNLFDREGAVSSFIPTADGSSYDSRDGKRHGRDSYGGSQMGGSGSPYGAYSSGLIGSSGLTSQNPDSRRKNYGH